MRDRKEVIEGGNSKVLYDVTNDELMIDQNVCRVLSSDVSVYKRVPICKLTNLPLFEGRGRTVNFVDSYFQYLSASKNGRELTTFLYQGYGDKPIINPAYLKSTCDIIYRGDDYSFFAAVTDCDIYLTVIDWNAKTQKYDVYSNLLSKTCFNAKKRAEIVKDWTDAIEMVYVEGRFYILTKNRFIVYSDCPTQWNKVYEVDCVYSNGDATETLFRQIRKYLYKK